MKEISFTVPLDAAVLRTTAGYLTTLANQMDPLDVAEVGPTEPPSEVADAFGGTPACQTNTAEPEIDKDGVPWDERIHSSNHKQTAEGRWAKRRGLEAGVYEAVLAELKGEPAPEATAPATAPTAPEATAPATAPTAPEANAPATDYSSWGAKEFMARLMQDTDPGAFQRAIDACKAHDVAAPALLYRPEHAVKVPAIAAAMWG